MMPCRICQQLMKTNTMGTSSLHMKSMQRMFQIHLRKPGYQFGCCEAGKLFERKILLVEQCIKINIPINTYTLYSIWITSRWDKL